MRGAIGLTVLIAAATLLSGCTMLQRHLDSHRSGSPTLLSFEKDESLDRLVLSAVPVGADWQDFGVRVTACSQGGGTNREYVIINLGTAAPYVNDVAKVSGADLNAAATGTACGAPVTAFISVTRSMLGIGDFLSICAGPVRMPSPPTDVGVAVMDTRHGGTSYSTVFKTVDVCQS